MKEAITVESEPGSQRKLVLMRGLPSCGKTWKARRIVAEQGGSHFEFDEFFESKGSIGGSSSAFSWDRRKLPHARTSQFARVRDAIDEGVTPIVVDDDHHPGRTAKAVAAYALIQGYVVEFAEPDSPWWQTIRTLLANKDRNRAALASWAQKLCRLSAAHHSVQLKTIVSRMERWDQDMNLIDILSWREGADKSATVSKRIAL